jgi:uncharacterized protein (TIGR02246 family)
MNTDVVSICRELVRQSAHCVDAGHYAELAELFTVDAVLVRPNGSRLEGREAILKAYQQTHNDLIKRHLVIQTTVQSLNSTSATAFTQVVLWKELPHDAASPPVVPPRAQQILGSYEDSLRIDNGRWLIAHRVAQFLLQS